MSAPTSLSWLDGLAYVGRLCRDLDLARLVKQKTQLETRGCFVINNYCFEHRVSPLRIVTLILTSNDARMRTIDGGG